MKTSVKGKPRERCVICDMKLPNRNQTCGGPECRALVILHPELADPNRVVRTIPKSHKFAHKKTVYLAAEEALVSRAWLVHTGPLAAADLLGTLVELSYDEWMKRLPTAGGLDLIETDPDNPWARGNRLIIGLYLESRRGDAPGASLTLALPKGSRMVPWIRKTLLGGSTDTPWDVFLAWRCACPESHRVTYRDLADVPSTVGYHDACPRCHYAPLEVTRG